MLGERAGEAAPERPTRPEGAGASDPCEVAAPRRVVAVMGAKLGDEVPPASGAIPAVLPAEVVSIRVGPLAGMAFHARVAASGPCRPMAAPRGSPCLRRRDGDRLPARRHGVGEGTGRPVAA